MSCLGDESINFLWLQVSLQWLEHKLWEAEGESCKLLGSANFNILSLMGPWFDNNLLVSHSRKILTRSIIKCVSQLLNLMDRAVESPETQRLGQTRLPFLLQSICWSSRAARCGPVTAVSLGFTGFFRKFCLSMRKPERRAQTLFLHFPRCHPSFCSWSTGMGCAQCSQKSVSLKIQKTDYVPKWSPPVWEEKSGYLHWTVIYK